MLAESRIPHIAPISFTTLLNGRQIKRAMEGLNTMNIPPRSMPRIRSNGPKPSAPLTMVAWPNPSGVSAAKTDYTARARTDIPGGLAAQAPSASKLATVAALKGIDLFSTMRVTSADLLSLTFDAVKRLRTDHQARLQLSPEPAQQYAHHFFRDRTCSDPALQDTPPIQC